MFVMVCETLKEGRKKQSNEVVLHFSAQKYCLEPKAQLIFNKAPNPTNVPVERALEQKPLRHEDFLHSSTELTS